ncbi:MAG: fimbrillin family protein, partial [Ruminococcaceae bacterium]|nr:fimbrillin family protein [Oscillospiraceae bacterium]
MKKLTLILLSILMIVTLAACGNKCAHTYDNACDVTCNECGEERTVTHDFADADCDTPKTCTVCGKTEGSALGHKPAEDDGDCTTAITCSVCGTITTPARDSHTGGEATCTHGKLCDICGFEYDTTKAPDNHASENYTYTDNGDGTHTKKHECGVAVSDPENHTIENHVCTGCGTMEIVVRFDAGDFEWKTGDELYFCRVSRDNQWEEYCFTATVVEDGTVTWTPDKPLYWDGTGEHKLVANYPAGTGYAWDRWYVPADQSTLEKLKAADHMNAMWKGNPTTDPINLNLKHRLSMVTVTYTLASEFEPNTVIAPEVYSNTQYMLFDIHTLERRNVEWQEGHAIWVTPYQHEGANGEKQFTAIVSPDAYSAGDDFVRIKIGDQVLSVKMPEAKTLEEGGEYTFDVKVGQDVIRIEEVSIDDIDSPFGDGWHNEIDLRVIGTQDEGKTAWEIGDQIIVTFTSLRFGTQYGTLTYHGTGWTTDVRFSYLENETPTVSAIYAPCYEVVDGNMQLKDGMQLGMTEYISAACSITDETLNISFEGVTRNYSRLGIIGLSNQTLTVITHDFTPAGATEVAIDAFALTTDDNGNAFLYGVFAEGATVSVKQGEVSLADYAFTAEKHPEGTKSGINYALDAMPVIDGTLGGKTEATEEDVNALVEQLKAYVDNGITTITVTGSEPALIEMDSWTNTAIGEAIYRLSGSDDYDENNPYNGKIDLILQDVTEIVDQEFYS